MRRLAPRLLPQLRILLLALLLPAASLAFLLPPPPASAAAAAPIATTTPSTILRAAALAPRSAAFARPGAARAAAPIAAPHRPYPRAFTTAAAGAATGGPSSSFMEAVTPTYIEVRVWVGACVAVGGGFEMDEWMDEEGWTTSEPLCTHACGSGGPSDRHLSSLTPPPQKKHKIQPEELLELLKVRLSVRPMHCSVKPRRLYTLTSIINRSTYLYIHTHSTQNKQAKRRGDPGLPKLQIVDVRDDDYEGASKCASEEGVVCVDRVCECVCISTCTYAST